jgi:hypothetical protein
MLAIARIILYLLKTIKTKNYYLSYNLKIDYFHATKITEFNRLDIK